MSYEGLRQDPCAATMRGAGGLDFDRNDRERPATGVSRLLADRARNRTGRNVVQMRRLGDERFLTTWIDSVNTDSTFNKVTRWFDGSTLIEDGATRCWLKIYAGKVIDRLPFMPPLGYTFKLSATVQDWDDLVAGTKLSDLMLTGRRRFASPDDFAGEPSRAPARFSIEGDLMSAHRVIAAVYALMDHYVATARALEVAA